MYFETQANPRLFLLRLRGQASRARHGDAIVYLAKFVDEWDFARPILDGLLYMRRLSWFRNTEEIGRADALEATTNVLRLNPDQVEPDIVVTIHGTETRLFRARRATYENPHLNRYFIYSMFAGYPRGIAPITDMDSLFAQIRTFPADRLADEFGDYVVFIHNIPQFFERVERACEMKNYGWKRHFVLYYNPESDSVGMNRPDNSTAMFCKPSAYSYQQEYRIAIDTGDYGASTLLLEIGDISDIAAIYETRSIIIKATLDRGIPRVGITGHGPLNQLL